MLETLRYLNFGDFETTFSACNVGHTSRILRLSLKSYESFLSSDSTHSEIVCVRLKPRQKVFQLFLAKRDAAGSPHPRRNLETVRSQPIRIYSARFGLSLSYETWVGFLSDCLLI